LSGVAAGGTDAADADADGCSSFACFCAEYLVPSFTPDARYLNPFDDTKATVLLCNASRRGWFGGVDHPSEELREQFKNNMSALNFDPITQNYTTSLAPEYKNTVTRSASRPPCVFFACCASSGQACNSTQWACMLVAGVDVRAAIDATKMPLPWGGQT
jgi:hypothetical protein